MVTDHGKHEKEGSKSMCLEIHVGQVVNIHDDLNEFASGEYTIRESYQNFRHADKINITALLEADTAFDDHATWILLESKGNSSRIQCNPLSITIEPSCE